MSRAVCLCAWLLLAFMALSVAAASIGDARSPGLILELETDTQMPYVQAQVRVTVRLLRNLRIRRAAMSTPILVPPQTDGPAIVRRLGNRDRQYRTERDGRIYMVNEQHYALFPQASGALRVGPARFEGQVVNPDGTLSLEHTPSNVLQLQVRPVPAAFTGESWIPGEAVERYQGFFPNSAEITVGEPISRNIFLSVRGATNGELPDFEARDESTLQAYALSPERRDEESGDGISAVLQQELQFVPTEPGRITLPAIEVPWWNTATDRQEIARFPAHNVTVLPAGVGWPSDDGGDSPSTPDAADRQAQTEPLRMFALLAAALVAIFGVAAWLVVNRHRLAIFDALQRRVQRWRKLRIALRACRNHDARDSKHALLELARLSLWAKDARSLGHLIRVVPEPLRTDISALNTALYSRTPQAWHGQRLGKSLSQWARSGYKIARAQHPRDLPPLYPLAEDR